MSHVSKTGQSNDNVEKVSFFKIREIPLKLVIVFNNNKVYRIYSQMCVCKC